MKDKWKVFFRNRRNLMLITAAVMVLLLLLAVAFYVNVTKEQPAKTDETKTKSEQETEKGDFDTLQASYSGHPYEGDGFDPSQVKLVGLKNDQVVEKIQSFDYEVSQDDPDTYIIYTSYGETMLKVSTVQVVACAPSEGEYAAGSSFYGNIELTYEDGTVKTISSEKVQFEQDEVLHEGLNELSFTYQGRPFVLSVTVGEKTELSEARELYKDDLAHSIYNHVTDQTFLTVMKVSGDQNYYLTHLILSDPSMLKVGTAGQTYGTYMLPDAAAASFNWLMGVSASSMTQVTGNSAQGCVIRDGKIVIGDRTQGNEICLSKDGTLFAAKAGKSAREMIREGVSDSFVSELSTLIENGVISTEAGSRVHPISAVGMVKAGEYYFVTSDEEGMAAKDVAAVLKQRGCRFAGITGMDRAVALYYHGTAIYEGQNDPLQDYLYVAKE